MALSEEKQEELVRECMRLAGETSAQGNLPFAALLIDKSGEIVLAAKNTVRTTNNAAAHAEINMLFDAGSKLQTIDLSDYAVVSNAASCPMCASAMLKAGIKEYYYGAQAEGGTIPNFTMQQVIDATPLEVNLQGGILATECTEQIKQLAKR